MLPLRLRLLKVADKFAGPGLLSLVGRLYRLEGYPKLGDRAAGRAGAALDPAVVGRILVIRPGGIGDAVLCFPMLVALRAHFNRASIDILAERRNAGVYAVNTLVREVFLYDRLSRNSLLGALASHYDLVIDTEQYHRLSTLSAFFTRSPHRCGFDTLGRGRFLTHRVRYREADYEIYSFLNLASATIGRNIDFDRGRPFMDVSPEWLDWAEHTVFSRTRGAPVVVLVTGTGTPTRVWPAENYRAVTRWLLDQGCVVCLLGGRESKPAATFIAAGLDSARIFNLVTRTTIPQSAAILKNAACYLGADCGVLHIAVAVGTPTVHMFGSGIQEKWAPVGPNYSLIDKQLPCSPCTRYGYTPPCPYGVACMKAITPEEVMGVLGRTLQSGIAAHGGFSSAAQGFRPSRG